MTSHGLGTLTGNMIGGAWSGLPIRDRIAISAGLVGVTVLAWAYLVFDAARMEGMTGEGSMGMGAMMPMWVPWGPLEFLLTYIMWAVMMVGMMMPSASPMILLFAAVSRKRADLGAPYAHTTVFIMGYVAVWTFFSLVAALGQWGLHAASLLSPMMVTTSPLLGGVVLITAGVYQWMPIKDACLAKCQSPLGFLLSEWRDGSKGAFIMGLRHGAFCTGCCWALMALLFVGGVMNLLWVASIAGFVLLEKVFPVGGAIAKAAGLGLAGWGGWMIVGALL